MAQTTCALTSFNFTDGLVPVKAQTAANLTSLDWCDMFQLISNVIGLMSYIAVAVATLGVIWGGVTLLISAGNESNIKKGKGIIKSALVGYAIVLAANFIVIGIFTAFGIDVALLPWQ